MGTVHTQTHTHIQQHYFTTHIMAMANCHAQPPYHEIARPYGIAMIDITSDPATTTSPSTSSSISLPRLHNDSRLLFSFLSPKVKSSVLYTFLVRVKRHQSIITFLFCTSLCLACL
ncbi:hypothetical protein NX059_010857 [Plenodomus lindquistii]|nr:hypothetical protein NX059_010857 [Plenodomus lindquistii]